MTAINVFAQRKARAGFLVTDTAVTHPDGRVDRHVAKVIYSVKGFPWAVGVTGNIAPELALQCIGEANPLTFKQLQKRLPIALRRAVDIAARSRNVTEADVFCQLKGCYWDFSRKRPICFVMQTGGVSSIANQVVEPYIWYDLEWGVGTHIMPDELLGRPVDITDPESFDAERDGLALISAQRRSPFIDITPGAEAGHCRIGGEIHLTEVRKTGVRVFAIGSFNDPIGERINPHG